MDTAMSFEDALFLLRGLLRVVDLEIALANPLISAELREALREHIVNERVHTLREVVVKDKKNHVEWLPMVDREHWYYWPRLRNYLLNVKGWPSVTVNSIDDSTDRVLGLMEDPTAEAPFDTKGLVIGYVQSGKTANYSSLIAKAADAGYRLVIVLTGITNDLRLQTQRRLEEELVGEREGVGAVGVGAPAPTRAWHTYTTAQLKSGDFDPGHGSSTATLVSPNPTLIVTKKNASVLNRLLGWLASCQPELLKSLPCLVIDDEADQASPNSGGNRSALDTHASADEAITEEDSPTAINKLIRLLLQKFGKVAYVAYTATPFANVLIDPSAADVEAGDDLYPKSFIVSLPKPSGYYGAEEIFGTETTDGMDVIEDVPEADVRCLIPKKRADIPKFQPTVPDSLSRAICDYVLAAAACIHRGRGGKPSTMLIHPEQSTEVQAKLTDVVLAYVRDLKNEWRYARHAGLRQRLEDRWEKEFRVVTRQENLSFDTDFTAIEPHIGPLLEQLAVRQINYGSEDELDYNSEPDLKAIVIGGNRLSRGLTLEGLLVSYFIRAANAYDTLMQMGRWFGYRPGYGDLTRIYITSTLQQWFRDLALVEQDIRAEIARYEVEEKTPLELAVRIRTHPTMLVTSPLKMRAATPINLSYAGDIVQTVTFPDDHGFMRHNVEAVQRLVTGLGTPTAMIKGNTPAWSGVPSESILKFLADYAMDPAAYRVQTRPIVDYIQRQMEYGELSKWLVAVLGQETAKPELGTATLGPNIPQINLIERTRLKNPLEKINLKTITSPGDRELSGGGPSLLIYPISKESGAQGQLSKNRRAIFTDPSSAEHVMGVAIMFPHSKNAATIEFVVVPLGDDKQ